MTGRGDGSNLTAEQILVIKFAAAVLDAEVAGRRTSQAARDLRELLPADYRQPDYTAIHDHVTGGEETS